MMGDAHGVAVLGDAWEKLRWARRHYDALAPALREFEETKPYSISVQADVEAGRYEFHVHDLQPPDPNWALILGDCIHNARSALDCLMAQLYGLASGTDPKDIDWLQFPITSEPDLFRGAKGIGKARKEIKFGEFLGRIEELQPYNASNPSIWGAQGRAGVWDRDDDDDAVLSTLPGVLKQLSDLDNVGKHRVVHALWTEVEFIQGLMPEPPPWPPAYKQRPGEMIGGAIENDAWIGAWTFATPLPEPWVPSQEDLKRSLPLQVSLDVDFIIKSVLAVVPLFLVSVGEVLRLFEPVLVHEESPLPAAAVRWPPEQYDGTPIGPRRTWPDSERNV
jgi:hypothetical protein